MGFITTVTGGFFNSEIVGGRYDREYRAEDFAHCFDGFIAEGVVGKNKEESDALQVVKEDLESTKVIIKPGFAWINGRWCDSSEEHEVNISMPTSAGTNRVDRILLRCDYDSRQFFLVIKSTPEVPVGSPIPEQYIAPENNRLAKEIPLASLLITDISTDISAVFVTDERVFSSNKINAVDFSQYYTKEQVNEKMGGMSLFKCTQEEYDAMQSHDRNTLYIIVEEETS